MNAKNPVKNTIKQNSSSFKTVAQYTKSAPAWGNSELHNNTVNKLRSICNKVNSNYGFSSLAFVFGKSQVVFINGLTEVNKTMTTELIANELQKDICCIGISTIASKYIGETERNLNSLFEKLQHTNTILYLDEAESLFAKASKATATHNNSPNISLNYLLQKIKMYEGVVILVASKSLALGVEFKSMFHLHDCIHSG